MHKRILAYAMALALAASLTACGRDGAKTPAETQTTAAQTTAAREAEGDVASPQPTTAQPDEPQTDAAQNAESPEETPDETPPADAQTGLLFQKFVRDKVSDGSYTLRTEQAGMKFIVSVDGKDSAIESDAAGILRFSLVHRDGSYYMIMHSTKKYTKMSEEEYKKQISSLDSSAAVNLDGMRYRSGGTESVDGKTYYTETYDEGEQGVVTYFFDDTGVRRTRVVKGGKTTVSDVFTVSPDADASMFEIPTDYTLVAEPAQLLA